MRETREKNSLYERLESSLKEGVEFANGREQLVTTFVPVGREISGAEVARIREKRRLSQSQFARLLAVSVKTLQSWEQGLRKPSGPTRRLLQIFDSPEEFAEVLGFKDGSKEPRMVAEPKSQPYSH